MHELSIALAIIDVATEELDRQGGGTVVALHLKVGALSGVVREALESAFQLAIEGSALERSRLDIQPVPVAILCPTCRSEQEVLSSTDLCCPVCGSYSAQIVRGRELEVVGMEIES